MTEVSHFWTTNDVGDGPSAGYGQSALFNVFRALFAKASNAGGVSPEFLNELAVSGASSPVAVATGAAVVYGIPYINDAPVNVAIPTPTTATRIDRVVLRASWAAQTVRVTRVAGTEGGAAPSLTQSAGTTWDIPLAQVSITTGGVITVTDERQWLDVTGDGVVTTTKLANDAVTNAKSADMAQATIKGRAAAAGTGDPTDLSAAQVRAILNVADGANAYVHPNHSGDVTSSGDGATTIANSAVTTAKINDGAVTESKLGTGAVTEAKIGAGAVTASKIATGAVPRMMVIPLGSEERQSTGTSFSTAGSFYGAYFDADKLPTNATVKLVAFIASTDGAKAAEARVNSITQSVASGISDSTPSVSGDFRAQLSSGLTHYLVESRISASGATAVLRSAHLLVEW